MQFHLQHQTWLQQLWKIRHKSQLCGIEAHSIHAETLHCLIIFLSVFWREEKKSIHINFHFSPIVITLSALASFSGQHEASWQTHKTIPSQTWKWCENTKIYDYNYKIKAKIRNSNFNHDTAQRLPKINEMWTTCLFVTVPEEHLTDVADVAEWSIFRASLWIKRMQRRRIQNVGHFNSTVLVDAPGPGLLHSGLLAATMSLHDPPAIPTTHSALQDPLLLLLPLHGCTLQVSYRKKVSWCQGRRSQRTRNWFEGSPDPQTLHFTYLFNYLHPGHQQVHCLQCLPSPIWTKYSNICTIIIIIGTHDIRSGPSSQAPSPPTTEESRGGPGPTQLGPPTSPSTLGEAHPSKTRWPPPKQKCIPDGIRWTHIVAQ